MKSCQRWKSAERRYAIFYNFSSVKAETQVKKLKMWKVFKVLILIWSGKPIVKRGKKKVMKIVEIDRHASRKNINWTQKGARENPQKSNFHFRIVTNLIFFWYECWVIMNNEWAVRRLKRSPSQVWRPGKFFCVFGGMLPYGQTPNSDLHCH